MKFIRTKSEPYFENSYRITDIIWNTAGTTKVCICIMMKLFPFKLGSILVVSPWINIHKTPDSNLPYDHFPSFPHKRFLRNIVVKVTELHFYKWRVIKIEELSF
ncbi:hypothetical protein H8356DRAFT_1346220 [Neocallimastix lanati (nom. inval.)]|nr:hypothetical protein H8356DRAFT_1346220 [Neocallimastix sp. JGI-2020a]